MGRTLSRGPRVVVTAVEHVARREVSCRRAQVVEAEPGVAAAAQRDRGAVAPLLGAAIAEHESCPFEVVEGRIDWDRGFVVGQYIRGLALLATQVGGEIA